MPRRRNTNFSPEEHDERCNVDIGQVVLHSDLMSEPFARESRSRYQLFEVKQCFRVKNQITFHRPRTWTLSGVTMLKDRESDRKKEWSWTLTVYRVQDALERRYMFHEIFLTCHESNHPCTDRTGSCKLTAIGTRSDTFEEVFRCIRLMYFAII